MFRTYHAAILRYSRRRADAQTAEEVVAETFAVAWRKLDRVPEGRRTLPWLYAVAGNELSVRRRRASSEDRKLSSFAVRAELVTPGFADALTEADLVRRSLAALDPRDREFLRLHAWEGLSRC